MDKQQAAITRIQQLVPRPTGASRQLLSNLCLHECFELVAAANPDATAAVFRERQLTFEQLDRLANKIASHLRSLAVGPEVRVAVLMRRSPELLAALLGVLKAGGVFVPLELTLPRERMKFLIEDSSARVVLTEEALIESLPPQYADSGTTCIVERAQEQLAGQSDARPTVDVRPMNLAYVLYTSGSTGLPKGVMVPHRGIVNYLLWCIEAYEIGRGNGAPVHTSVGFDLTLTSLFGPLVAGRPVVLLPESEGVEALATTLRARPDFSIVKITPAHLEMLGDLLVDAQISGSVRTLVVGGESLRQKTLEFWQAHAPDTRVVNEYGPTETVVGCCVYNVPVKHLATVTDIVPIGLPIANTQLHVLDGELQPVPPGGAGDLYIGGDGVARGYLGRPDLTADRFVPDPFSSVPGARLYRSGDWCRWRPDGVLEFLGRTDHQVKVRGFRVELDEISVVLAQHPKIRKAVVLARQGNGTSKRLIGYVVLQPGTSLASADMRAWLSAKLPEYMIPEAFVQLASLPLTSNGKVDRLAIESIEPIRTSAIAAFVAPRTSTEGLLVKLWAEVLGSDTIGVHDNFFELGGDSIRGIQLVARARAAGLKLTPRQIFDFPTIAALASVVSEAPAASPAGQGAVGQDLVTGPVPLTPIQQWFLGLNLPEPHHWNQAVMIKVPCGVNASHLERAVERLVLHHDALHLRFLSEANWRQVGTSDLACSAFSEIDLSAVVPQTRRRIMQRAVEDAQAGLNLTDGPMVRVLLLRLGDGRADRLLIVIHHLVVDTVSWRILLEDLATAYEQLQHGQEPELPPKTTSYRTWARGLTELADAPSVQSATKHWLHLISRPMKPLPRDYTAGLNSLASTREMRSRLGRSETKAFLDTVSRTLRVQVNDVLLAALAHTIRGWSGMSSLLVHVEGHGREDLGTGADLSRTVGWFTALFPVWIDLTEADSFRSAIQLSKEQQRAVPHRGMSYGLLRYMTSRHSTRSALATHSSPEVLFNYLGHSTKVMSGALGWEMSSEPIGPLTSSRGARPYVLEVHSIVEDEQLMVKWSYSANLHRKTTIRRLVEQFEELLRSLSADGTNAAGSVEYTPHDFPDAGLSATDLRRLLGRFSGPVS